MSMAPATLLPSACDSALSPFTASGDGEHVEVVETERSWVFFTNRYAYKVKKPVNLADVPCQSLAQRRQACVNEVWLNRRLANDVYLGVVPLVRNSAECVQIGGKGTVIEWALKMRRLNQQCNLLRLIENRQLTPTQSALLGAALARFYVAQPPETEVLDRFYGRLQLRIEANGEHNCAHLPVALQRRMQRVAMAQSDYLQRARMVLNLRVCDGRVVDGHGDLRPEHVFLERQPAIIDCAESSASRRHCDALDDLSALTMECRRLGRNDVAEGVMEVYRDRSGDERFARLEAFYRSLHASERARAAANTQVALASAYLDQADADAKVLE